MPEPTPQPPSDSLLNASLLAATGGLLDALFYVLHGQVFANAMTGNVIFLGISMLSRDWQRSIHHFVPLISFLVGVIASRYLRLLNQFYASVAVLTLEMIVLFIAGLLPPSFPEMAFTAIVAFTSALQVSTFRQAGSLAYNSTFITGNLRTAAESFVNQFLVRDPLLRHREAVTSRKLFVLCAYFLLGAIVGAWGASHLGNRTLWLTEPMLLIVLARVVYLKADAGIFNPG